MTVIRAARRTVSIVRKEGATKSDVRCDNAPMERKIMFVNALKAHRDLCVAAIIPTLRTTRRRRRMVRFTPLPLYHRRNSPGYQLCKRLSESQSGSGCLTL